MATDAGTQAATPTGNAEHDKLKRLGKYVIQRRLGAGGMGTVFLAVDGELSRTVALKVLSKDRAGNPTLVKRFKSEGQSAARLEDEHIVKVYEAGEINGFLYLALEYVDGIDVQELVRKRGPLPVKRSIDVIRQVARALEHAREKNIVHRDIKPSNLLIRKDGVVKLADMGLARVVDEAVDTSITRDGMTVGTVDYMSPEQARDSKAADIRSDIYSLGCTWYHMLTGSPPYPEGSVTAKLQAHATAAPADPRRVNELVPEAVVAIIQKMMAKRPIDRYQTPAELLEDLQQAHISRAGVGDDILAGLSAAAEAPAEAADQATAAESTQTTATSPSEAGKVDRREHKGKADRKPPPREAPTRPSRKSGQSGAPRELPPRSDELPQKSEPGKLAAAVPQRNIDPVLVQYGLYGLIALALIGGLVTAIRLGGGDSGPSGGGINPYLAAIEKESAANAEANKNPSTSPPAGAVDPSTTSKSGNSRGSAGNEAPAAVATNVASSRSDFPGLDDVPAGTLGKGVSDVPAWVPAARRVKRDGLPSMRLSSGGEGNQQTLQSALETAARSGAVIELNGRGPFVVTGLEAPERGRLVITAAAGSQPLIVIAPEQSPVDRSVVTFRGGHVELSGVHVVFSGRDGGKDTSLIGIEGATLVARDCSFILADPSPQPVTAIVLRGKSAGAPARCVLENAVFRGNNLTAVKLEGASQELVAGNCLIASGDAPALSLVGGPAGDAGAGNDYRSSIELLASTVLTRHAALRLVQRELTTPAKERLRTRRVAFVADGADAVWMRLQNWPESSGDNPNAARARGVDWTSDRTVFVGWTDLVDMAPPAGAAIQVRDAGAFGQFWRAPSESRDFAPPLAGNRFRDHTRIDPPALDEAVSARLAEAGADARAGCLAGLLPEAPTTLVERWLALSARPRLPRGFGQPPPGKELRFDLARGATLNRTLNSSEVPSGARVVLFGAMRKQLIEPVILRNKTLRIEFEEGDEPLQIEPTARSGDERPSALFRVEGGHLDLVGARIRVPSSATRNYPLRILEVVDGSFSVQNCVLQGQIRDGAEDVPVIEWTRSGAAQPDRDYGLIVDSFIGARHRVIGGDLSGRLLEVHNSVLAGLGNGFDVALGTSVEGHVLLRNCTLSGVESIVRVRTPGGDGSARLNFFVKNAVFAPPVESLPGGPAVMTHPQGADQDGRIVWWEEGTAYAQQVQRYRVLDGSKAAGAQDFDAVWVRPWGPDHVLHALTGPKAVLLASNLPSPDRLEAASFRLSEACGAYRWGEGGTPVGAHVEEVGPTKPDAKPQAQSPRATRPAGKSQPGF